VALEVAAAQAGFYLPIPGGGSHFRAPRRPVKAAARVHRDEEKAMQWTDPAFCDIRLGFEVTAYVYVR